MVLSLAPMMWPILRSRDLSFDRGLRRAFVLRSLTCLRREHDGGRRIYLWHGRRRGRRGRLDGEVAFKLGDRAEVMKYQTAG